MSHDNAEAMEAVAHTFKTSGYQAARDELHTQYVKKQQPMNGCMGIAIGGEILMARVAECQADADAILAKLARRRTGARRSSHYRKKARSHRIPLPHRAWF